jgi:hypothetical protein
MVSVHVGALPAAAQAPVQALTTESGCGRAVSVTARPAP